MKVFYTFIYNEIYNKLFVILLLTTLLLSESTNGLINPHTLIANTANIKRNAVTAADDPVDRTVTHYGVPQTDSATRFQSSMTAELQIAPLVLIIMGINYKLLLAHQ